MYQPTFAETEAYLGRYNIVPIMKELVADTETPIKLFQRFYERKNAFLLESVEGGAKWARYSFIGFDPFLIVRGKGDRIVVQSRNEAGLMEERVEKGSPIETLKTLMTRYQSPPLDGLPRFSGGAVGFFAYDLVQIIEQIPAHQLDDLQMDHVHFLFCDQVIVFDHLKQRVKVIANMRLPQEAEEQGTRSKEVLEKAYKSACRQIESIVAELQKRVEVPLLKVPAADIELSPEALRANMSREQYEQNVRQAQEYIRAGDVFQVVLSQRFELDTDIDPLAVYRVLRTINPSPYMYLLKLGETTLVGTSPELLVRVEGGAVETMPIAGTRPRGESIAEDERLEQELLADEKELAEHRMLVDLGRNDIGRVAEYGSVQVNRFMSVERYSHVMHIVSNVTGKLRQGCDYFDAIRSCLPAGTVSGAPKVRAMEIIAELERESRGAYAGAIGYLGFTGNLDSCITIRTIIFKQGKAYVQAGAGIVADSKPANEYLETVNKARGMLKAIKVAEQAVKADDLFALNRDEETEVSMR